MMTKEILKQALEALESENPYHGYLAAHAIRNALEQPVQAPVGKVIEIGDNGFKCEFNQRLAVGTKLYIAPPLPVQPVQEPTPWRDMVVVSLVREGINKHKARELADHFVNFTLTPPLLVQEPVAWEQFYPSMGKGPFTTSPLPVQRKPLTDDVLVPLKVLEAAANSLDSFCGNLGWGDADLQNMDNLFAVIEQHKAAHGIKET
jgi:hypothetical protein